MKAKVKVLSIREHNGTGKNGKPYEMFFAGILDLETYDKLEVIVDAKQADALKLAENKDGVATLGYDPSRRCVTFIDFKVAA